MSVRALTALSTIIATTVLTTLAGSAPAQTLPIREVQVDKRATLKSTKQSSLSAAVQAQLRQATRQVIQARRIAWNCQDNLIASGIRDSRTQASQSVWALPRSVGYRAWVASKWTSIAKGCQKMVTRVIPSNLNWIGSIQWVQSIYPGTYDWLYNISGREGSHGVWQWYRGACGSPPCLWRGHHVGGDNVTGADTVGGWLQFRYSTFAPYWRQAEEDLRRRGYIIPAFKMPPAGGDFRYAAWLHPMGQALAGAYMRYAGKDGHHWSATSWGY